MKSHLKVHYFQHIAGEGFGSCYEYLKQLDAQITATEFFALPLDRSLDIEALPNNQNAGILQKVKQHLQFAAQRAVTELDLEFSIVNKKSGFSYSEYATATALINQIDVDLDIQKASIVTVVPESTPSSTTEGEIQSEIPSGVAQEPARPVIRKIKAQLPAKNLTVIAYKEWLTKELQKVANANADDEIEFEN